MSSYVDKGYDDFELSEFVACAPNDERSVAVGWAYEQLGQTGVTKVPQVILESLIALHLISEGVSWE